VPACAVTDGGGGLFFGLRSGTFNLRSGGRASGVLDPDPRSGVRTARRAVGDGPVDDIAVQGLDRDPDR